ncbi:MAG: amidohydrolase family protein, partial [Anaerolineae bacterium]|nr:amidohydrolase family protein [Anaerolineae bacterium]
NRKPGQGQRFGRFNRDRPADCQALSGTLVFGTYAPNARPLSSPGFEFRVMALMGMTPMEMIEAATVNAAHAIGLGDTVGTLEPGKQADIIVVAGDLFDDFDAIRDVLYVVKGGELVVGPEG